MQHQSTGAVSALGVTAGQRGGAQLVWESRSVSPETFRPGSDGYKWMGKTTNLLLLLKLIEK